MRRVFLMMAACCVLASPALAGGGAVDLYGVYGAVVDGEYEPGIGVRLSLGSTHWMVDFGATAFMEVEDTPIFDENPNKDDSMKYRAFELGMRYLFYDLHKVRPYVGAGLSYAQTNATDVRMGSGLGFYVVAGLRVGRVPGINFMAELIYRHSEVETTYNLIETTDVTVGGIGLQVGASFVF